MTVTVYRSTDTSAPSLDGNAGSLVTVLDAVLVNGYGSKSAAGWSIAFSGTNKRAYQQGAKTGASAFYLRLDDTAPGAVGGRAAWGRGYETMSDVDTGVNGFPTSVQDTDGVHFAKSIATGATTRPWIVFADHRTWYMIVFGGLANATTYSIFAFGDFVSYTPGDLYNCFIAGSTGTQAILGNPTTYLMGSQTPGIGLSSWTSDFAICRDFNAIAGAMIAGSHGDGMKLGQTTGVTPLGGGTLPWTHPIDGRVYFSPVFLTESSVVRGYLRGFWCILHAYALWTDEQQLDDGSGRTILLKKPISMDVNTATSGGGAFEVSNTWDTN